MAVPSANVVQCDVPADLQYRRQYDCGKVCRRKCVGSSRCILSDHNYFMAFAVGMNLGASVVVSRLFGAEDRGGVKRAVTTAFLSSMVLGIQLDIIPGYFFNHQMMRWIRTPQNIMADGVLYLKIYIFGIIFLMLYNVCTGVFTALGILRHRYIFCLDPQLEILFLITSS